MNGELERLQKRAYNLYVASWLNKRNILITDLLMEDDEFQPTKGCELFVCFDEFLNNEFQDRDYIWTILNQEDFNLWKKFN